LLEIGIYELRCVLDGVLYIYRQGLAGWRLAFMSFAVSLMASYILRSGTITHPGRQLDVVDIIADVVCLTSQDLGWGSIFYVFYVFYGAEESLI
jgi:hypothetical protein